MISFGKNQRNNGINRRVNMRSGYSWKETRKKKKRNDRSLNNLYNDKWIIIVTKLSLETTKQGYI